MPGSARAANALTPVPAVGAVPVPAGASAVASSHGSAVTTAVATNASAAQTRRPGRAAGPALSPALSPPPAPPLNRDTAAATTARTQPVGVSPAAASAAHAAATRRRPVAPPSAPPKAPEGANSTGIDITAAAPASTDQCPCSSRSTTNGFHTAPTTAGRRIQSPGSPAAPSSGRTLRTSAPAATASQMQNTAVSTPVSGHTGTPTTCSARVAHTTATSCGTARAADSPSPSAASDRGGVGVATQSLSRGNPGRATPASSRAVTTAPTAASTAASLPAGRAITRREPTADDMRSFHHARARGRPPPRGRATGGQPPGHRGCPLRFPVWTIRRARRHPAPPPGAS